MAGAFPAFAMKGMLVLEGGSAGRKDNGSRAVVLEKAGVRCRCHPQLPGQDQCREPAADLYHWAPTRARHPVGGLCEAQA
eukprot:4503216-Lingulodinium_polyedra.AAC.1